MEGHRGYRFRQGPSHRSGIQGRHAGAGDLRWNNFTFWPAPVNAVAAEHSDFVLFSFDASQAFAKEMTFAEISALTGVELREVQFDVPAADLKVLQQVPGRRAIRPPG